MKAAFRTRYGPPAEIVSIKEIAKPTPKDNEVLIRVHAASANRSDHFALIGQSLMRPFIGLFRPKKHTIGCDFAGQVEAIGAAVKNFKVDDKVMGFGGIFGADSIAEYMIFPERKGIVLMPENF